jgi:hypothetical protein
VCRHSSLRESAPFRGEYGDFALNLKFSTARSHRVRATHTLRSSAQNVALPHLLIWFRLPHVIYTIPSGYEAKGIVAGNFTGHTGSTLDLAVLLASTSTDAYAVAVYTGSGSGTFATPVVSAAGNGVSSGAQSDSIVAADFNGGTDTDIAFTTDNGLLDEMIPTASGSMSAATSLLVSSPRNPA